MVKRAWGPFWQQHLRKRSIAKNNETCKQRRLAQEERYYDDEVVVNNVGEVVAQRVDLPRRMQKSNLPW